MRDLEEFKRFLGPIADDYSDIQLKQLSYEMEAIAEFLVDLYLGRSLKQSDPSSPIFDSVSSERRMRERSSQ